MVPKYFFFRKYQNVEDAQFKKMLLQIMQKRDAQLFFHSHNHVIRKNYYKNAQLNEIVTSAETMLEMMLTQLRCHNCASYFYK